MAPKKRTGSKADEPETKKAKEEPNKEAPKAETKKVEAKIPARIPAAVKKGEAKKEEAEIKEEKIEEKFQEADAPTDNRPALKSSIGFATEETTLNVLPTWGGKVLTTITEGGMAYLLAGARANVGLKSGRYMFEVKIVQSIQTAHAGQKPKQLVRVGFSTSSSSLILGEGIESVCFDCDGFFTADSKRAPGGQRFGREQVIAIILNLDSKSTNYNTITLYKEGAWCMEPKPLPEALKGKTLFPHVTYRNVSIAVNFGPSALKALPFNCRLAQTAAASDVEVAASKAPKDGKYEVVVPVGFPDEGTFDWLDMYLEKNPHYVELSDRKIIDWAKSSGLWPKTERSKCSNDKPQVSFGVPAVDDFGVRKVIAAVAPVVPRNYLIMEVKSNLLASERKEVLKKFNYPCYKKIAHVVMGEPAADFKAIVHNKLLKDKQVKSDEAWKEKKADDLRKKKQLQRERELRRARRKAEKMREEQKKKRLADLKAKEEERKAREAARKAKIDAALKAKEEAEKKAAEEAEKKEKGEDGAEEKKPEEKTEEASASAATEEKPEDKEEKKEEEPAEEKKEEEKEEEKKEESESEDEPEGQDMDTDPPVAELDEEEKKVNFLAKSLPDLTPQVMSSFYGKFTTPNDEEGFDEIRYEWDKDEKADEYLKSWVLNKKKTTRIEDLRPGAFFKEKMAEFAYLLQEWQEKQKAYAPKKAKDSDEKPAHKKADFDIFSVADLDNVDGNGAPLYESFGSEDWALVQLRFELYILCVSFKKDADDGDREGIPMDHLNFYFNKYFHKQLVPKVFGLSELDELLAMITDTVASKECVLVTQLAEDLEGTDIFVKLAEEHRRERQRRIDAGDETARLKFTPNAKVSTSGGKIMPPATIRARIEAAKAAAAAAVEAAGPDSPKKSPAVAPAIPKILPKIPTSLPGTAKSAVSDKAVAPKIPTRASAPKAGIIPTIKK